MASGPAGSRLTDPAPVTVPVPAPAKIPSLTVAPEGLQLGAVKVSTPVILAPMAGVTDQAFRKVCRDMALSALPAGVAPGTVRSATGPGAGDRVAPGGLFVTEMVTARALLEGNPRSWQMVEPDQGEHVRSVQLYGTDPATLGQAAGLLVERGLADHIDLNFGCPVPKVTRKGGGAAIPWKRDLFQDIVTSVVTSVEGADPNGPGHVPVTVKMRIGIDDDHVTVLDAAKIAQDAGVSGVGLHARTQAQYYSGQARWPWITDLKQRMKIPVFGNGDIFSAEDAQAMFTETGSDAVIIGRGCQGRPWLFREITAALWGQEAPPPPSLGEVVDILRTHAQLTVEFSGSEDRALKEMRKHVGWYLRGFAVGGEQRRELNLVQTLAELDEGLSQLDLDQPFPAAGLGSRGRKGSARKPHLPHGWLDSKYLSEDERADLIYAEDDVSGG